MSIVAKISPVGIDVIINNIQADVFSFLTTQIAEPWTNYESYPRVYKNAKGDNVNPEHYKGNKEYEEVLFNDKFNATSFFLTDDNRTVNEQEIYSQDVSIVFQGQLDKLYPAIPHRADEEMHNDINSAIRNKFRKYITGITTGVSNVYSDLSIDTERINLDDMSFDHVVKVDLTIPYELTVCGVTPKRG